MNIYANHLICPICPACAMTTLRANNKSDSQARRTNVRFSKFDDEKFPSWIATCIFPNLPTKNAPTGFTPNDTKPVTALRACDFRNLMTKSFLSKHREVRFEKFVDQKRPRRVHPGGARIGSYRAYSEICPRKVSPHDTEMCDLRNLLTKNAPAWLIPVERGLASYRAYSEICPRKGSPHDTEKCDLRSLLTKNTPTGFVAGLFNRPAPLTSTRSA